jgi:trypsin-like peptidase/von Willebrand factor type A domain-containing protein
MSHCVGTVQPVSPVVTIGPDSGATASAPNIWKFTFNPPAAANGTKLFLILHFQSAVLPVSNRLEVDLNYGAGEMDIFTSADGTDFWTRPINIYPTGGSVEVRYITNGASNGSVQLDRYGRGERHAGIQDPTSTSNCDVFIDGASYTEPPKYDPFWFCTPPPNWENASCVPDAGDIRNFVRKSVGMIVHEDSGLLSTCSVTLVGPDLCITAGHCMTDPVGDAASGSVIFDFDVNCDGTKPMGYQGRFFKVANVIKQKWDGTNDYCLFKLKTAPGLPPLEMRHDLPAVGEQVFGIHHPNGAVKKISYPHTGLATVTGSSATAINVPLDFSVSGGSSGSGIFDTAGRILGVLSHGAPCSSAALIYYPTASILPDIAPTPPPPITRDVMIVLDRSGSMSVDGGSGRPKIQEARDAASLFVELVRAGTGNRVGMVSFSTTASSPVDFALAAVTAANKTALIGPPPYAGGKVGAVAPGGSTTIGGGLKAGGQQLTPAGSNPRSILLLTDGLQNTPPMIDDAPVQAAISGIDINAIGYGTAANLDGTLLSALAGAHSGQYVRADDNLQLEKYFAQAFGNIFEAGLLTDPEFVLPQDQQNAADVPFSVCEEETITAIVGWDNPDGTLIIELTTPLGAAVTSASAGVETATGNTWAFLRVPLPQSGERDGTWKVRIFRPGGGGEFPPPAPRLRYFVNVVAGGGARLVRVADNGRYYTGDHINPLVLLRYENGGTPNNAKVRVVVTRPTVSVGTTLSQSKLGPATTINADTIPPRQATLMALEAKTGRPVVSYAEQTLDLGDDASNARGVFEAAGLFGKPIKDLLLIEGNYTFRFQASYGVGCTSTRELLWSLHVEVGVDPGRTTVTTTLTGTTSGGERTGTVTIVPRDVYGNNLGPGKGDGLTVSGTPGTTVTGPVTDNGDGSYTVPIQWNDGSGYDPGIVVGQPGRPGTVIQPIPKGRCGKWKWLFWLMVLIALILLLLLLLVLLLK